MEQARKHVAALVAYALENALIEAPDVVYVQNKIIHLLHLQYPVEDRTTIVAFTDLATAYESLFSPELKAHLGISTQAQALRLWSSILDVFVLRPSNIMKQFSFTQPDKARAHLTHFYEYCKKIDYVKERSGTYFNLASTYGELEITVNTAKPEKDPTDIALLLEQPAIQQYPLCPLCLENVGNFGDGEHAPRSQLRVLPFVLNHENWYFQFSPYSYYHEHAIVLSEQHVPMVINEKTFKRLFDFLTQVPHYFIGANADIPIVGGSILNHDHFQAGDYEFPLMRAQTVKTWDIDDVQISLLHWPLSCIKITACRVQAEAWLIHFWQQWLAYENETLEILKEADGKRQNAITPIIRQVDGVFEVYIALRNNGTSAQFPTGIFHPHADIHPIKKENIGLIEVAGYAILPGRLATEIATIITALQEKGTLDAIAPHHQPWLHAFLEKKGGSLSNIADEIWEEVATLFLRGLEDAKVFKADTDAIVFIEEVIKHGTSVAA